jgi:hypothetical protein
MWMSWTARFWSLARAKLSAEGRFSVLGTDERPTAVKLNGAKPEKPAIQSHQQVPIYLTHPETFASYLFINK